MGKILLFFLLSLILEGVFCDMEVVSVKGGDSVTLHTDSQIQKGDVTYWKFGPKRILIARYNKAAKVRKINEDELEGKFKGRLKLDDKTGDLTITNIRTTDSGEYEVSSDDDFKKSFNVSVLSVDFTMTVSVLEGNVVTLSTDVPDIKIYDAIEWRFEHQKSPLAEIKPGNVPKYDETDKRFKGKLQLDPQTGSLTIKNIRTELAGLYVVDIISSGHTVHKSYNVTVGDVLWSEILKKQGDQVLLHTGTNVQDSDLIQWKFRDVVLAEMYKAENRFSTYDGPDGRLRLNRLKLNKQTGDLTIMEINPTDAGFYELMISSNRHTVLKKFTVSVSPDAPREPSGWPSGAVAGIVVCLLLLLVAVALVIYYRRKIADLEKLLNRDDVLVPKPIHTNNE